MKKIPTTWKSLSAVLFLLAVLCFFAKETGSIVFFAILAVTILFLKRGAEEPKEIIIPENFPHLA